MVATRRGAKTGADEDSTSIGTTQALRKKPTRKAAARSTTPAPHKPIPKPRATRARKAEQVAQDEQDEESEGEPEDAAELPKTRQATTRAKRAETKAVEPSATQNVTSKPTAKTTRATNTRSKKAEIHNDEAPEIQPGPKARATRTTRAKAAIEKAKVLSPKKVTQVSKGPLRSTKASSAKITSKPMHLTTVVPTRLTRRRAISDENAEVPASKGKVDEDADEISMAGISRKPLNKPRKAPVVVIASDSEMSSRPTTPADSLRMDLDRTEEELDDRRQELASQHDESDDEAFSASEDELCGPKTPLRRSTQREAVRYGDSPDRALQHGRTQSRTQTPIRSISDRRRGTPQTQKPCARTGSPILGREPMTIARATNRAMVFPELKPLVTCLDTRSRTTFEPQLETEEGQAIEKNCSSSSLPSRICQESMADPTEESDEELDSVRQISSLNDVTFAEVSGEKLGELYDECISASHELDNDTDEDATELDATPREHMAIHGVEVFEDDESVIIASNRRALEQVSPTKSFEIRSVEEASPNQKPETLIWENIRQDETMIDGLVPEHDTPDSLPEPDQTEILSPTASFGLEERTEQNTSDVAEELQAMVVSQEVPRSARRISRISMASNRPSLDGTIHLSQFIDVDSLFGTNSDSTHKYPDESGIDTEIATNLDDFTHSTPMTTPIRTKEWDEAQAVMEQDTPRYAQPTMASAVKRRQSLPAVSFTSPFKSLGRPNTSDGASLPRLPMLQPFQTSAMSSPLQTSTSAATSSQLKPVDTCAGSVDTPRRARPAAPRARMSRPKTPSATSPRHAVRGGNKMAAPQTVAGDRFNDLKALTFDISPLTGLSEENDAISTVKAARFGNKERYPGLPSRTTYDELVETPITGNVVAYKLQTPETARLERPITGNALVCRLRTPETVKAERPVTSSTHMSTKRIIKMPTTRTPVREEAPSPSSVKTERYPGLPSRRTYEEHAKTAMVPTRFRTVSHVPAKRPASAMKASSLGDRVREEYRNPGTPTKTPLKPPGMTPGQVPMTPHPAAPLNGVLALVDVWTNDASPASSVFITLLQRLGARTTKTWSKRVTHVVFKSGSPGTLKRLRLHNKEVEESGVGGRVFCVNSRWVTDCDAEGRRVDETDDEYVVDVEEACRGSKRRCKSMEPADLVNIGGNVIRDRKSSAGRASLGRPSVKQAFAADPHTDSPHQSDSPDKENSDRHDDSSPVTPAYLAAPNLLVQQTAPMNRVRKLAFGPSKRGKERRTTVWNLEF